MSAGRRDNITESAPRSSTTMYNDIYFFIFGRKYRYNRAAERIYRLHHRHKPYTYVISILHGVIRGGGGCVLSFGSSPTLLKFIVFMQKMYLLVASDFHETY